MANAPSRAERRNQRFCGSIKSTEVCTYIIYDTNVGSNWPLISILLSDEVYRARYREHLEHALEGAFAIDAVDERMHELHSMIAPYVVGPDEEILGYTTITSAEAFDNAIDGEDGLLAHIKSSRTRQNCFLFFDRYPRFPSLYFIAAATAGSNQVTHENPPDPELLVVAQERPCAEIPLLFSVPLTAKAESRRSVLSEPQTGQTIISSLSELETSSSN